MENFVLGGGILEQICSNIRKEEFFDSEIFLLSLILGIILGTIGNFIS